MPRPILIAVIALAGAALGGPRPTGAQPYLSNLQADADAPLFATYAAPPERSSFIIDEGYHFRYYGDADPIEFTTDTAGSMGVAFVRGGDVRLEAADMHERPVVTASYSDLVRYRFRPYPDILVRGHFQVYSSAGALHVLEVTNESDRTATLDVHPYLRHRIGGVEISDGATHASFSHAEPPDNWILDQKVPHVEQRGNVWWMADPTDRLRAFSAFDGDFAEALRGASPPTHAGDSAGVVSFHRRIVLDPAETAALRLVRTVGRADAKIATLLEAARSLTKYDPDEGLRAAERRYARIPRPAFTDPNREAVYWSAFSLMRQVMMPPEGRASHNYYVFSREPTWGWGHGGQVFHESLTMLAYVHMDPEGALNSQRVYMERQHEDGYINYRSGSYLDEMIPTDGVLTTSAPWYNWINWELYRETGDREFLAEAYRSGADFYAWWLRNRDADGDGLAEWGGHGVLESVRDGFVATWDEVGWPSNFEAVDLNSMLVVEARSLAEMAEALGDSAAARRWRQESDRRGRAVNDVFWDETTGFYYHVDADDHDFTFDAADDLKRQEIIGMLPLWAGIADDEQAARLVDNLTDPDKFWRPYGVPSLAADDPYYDPMGYWNGPVWVEWQYLLFRGLLNYGYRAEAKELADRVLANVTHHLKESHTFWELYSPDALEAGHHQTYIWTALVVSMMNELDG